MAIKTLSVAEARKLAQKLIIEHGVSNAREFGDELLIQYSMLPYQAHEDESDEGLKTHKKNLERIYMQTLRQGDRVLTLFQME